MEEVYVEEFMSPGCVGCPAVKEMLKELSAEFGGNLIVEEVYGIMSVPAVAVNGILKFMGVPSKEELKKAILEEIES